MNFQRIIPKATIFKNSDVFKHLNEEAIKTKAEKDKETKKWTTFLQKPDRPIPKSKADLEFEKRIPYKVNITKQPKPRCDPNRGPSPPPPAEVEKSESPEKENTENGVSEDTENKDPEAPESTEATDETSTNGDQPNESGKTNCETNGEGENGEAASENGNADGDGETTAQEDPNNTNDENKQDDVQKSPEDLIIEQQLASVQKQLQALSSLPSTIQATLDAVTKQIEELIPALNKRRESMAQQADKTDEEGLYLD